MPGADGLDPVVTSRFAGPGALDGTPQQPVVQQPIVQQSAAPAPPKTDDDVRRNVVREGLIADAVDNFQRVAPLADDTYSRQLRERGAQVSRYMQQEEHSPKAGAAYMDPNEFVTGLALGMEARDVTRAMLEARHITPTDTVVKEITDSMTASFKPRIGAGPNPMTQSPHAQIDYFTKGPQRDAIVPASDYFPPEVRIKGFTHQQNLDFINGHEGWHAKDTRNTFQGLDPEEYRRMNLNPIETAVQHPERLQMLAISNRQESLADVGSVGDMIRKGGDPGLINGVLDFRHNFTDPSHMTAAALTSLQQKINDMGVDKFRQLNDTQARALYNDIADKNALTPAQVGTVISFTRGTQGDRDKLHDSSDPATHAALKTLDPYDIYPPKGPDGKFPQAAPAPLTPAEEKAQAELGRYDPGRLLQDRAFKDAHKITPTTLIKAYGELQDDLHRKIDKDPDNPLYQAQAMQLQDALADTVQTLDYVGANVRRGVDIYKVEPSLRGLDPAATAPHPPHAPVAPSNKSVNIAKATVPGAPAAATGMLRKPGISP